MTYDNIIIAERTMCDRLFQLVLTELPDRETWLVTIRNDAGQWYVADQHIGPLDADSSLIDDALSTFGIDRTVAYDRLLAIIED